MGEYAELFFREEMQNRYGFDPGEGSLDPPKKKREKLRCRVCGKWIYSRQGLQDHTRDKHTRK